MSETEAGRDIPNLTWGVIGLGLFANVALSLAFGFHFRPAPLGTCAVCIAAPALAAWTYTRWRPDARIAAAFEAVALVTALLTVGGTLSYLIAGLDRPLIDSTLASLDDALGLGWRAYFDFVVSRPVLDLVLEVAYQAFLPMMVVVVITLSACRQLSRLATFSMALTLALFATAILSGLFPARNTYLFYGLGPVDHAGVRLVATTDHIADLLALRDGSMRLIDMTSMKGIVTFPSFHTVLACIAIWALWSVPYVRWASLALNGTMIVATPVQGSHYFIDVIAGGVVAILSVAAASGAAARLGRRGDPLVPAPAFEAAR